ncbi:MAG: hypothetical protein QOE44_2930, partial [Solirubrobacteraceae bacterium]|nr:hypothetical protein [Solirubrobacteraceae bacterium]
PTERLDNSVEPVRLAEPAKRLSRGHLVVGQRLKGVQRELEILEPSRRALQREPAQPPRRRPVVAVVVDAAHQQHDPQSVHEVNVGQLERSGVNEA